MSTDELNTQCESFDYSGSYLEYDEALDYLFATQIQPKFEKKKIYFVTHFPATQAALAEINPENNKTSLRFEVFYHGHELGNGYQELTDSEELLSRFKHDNVTRNSNDLNEIQIDHHLIEAMRKDSTKSGLPKCSGIAIGLDRLLMVLLGASSIREVMPFNAQNS